MTVYKLIVTAMICLAPVRVTGGLPASTQTRTYSLEELIESAMRHHAEIVAGEWQVREAHATLNKAQAAYLLPRLRLEGESGLVPDAEGDVFNPPADTSGLRPMGPFARLQLEFAQPLFTFGHLRHQTRAARANVDVERAALADTRLELALEVRKLYYAILLGQEVSALIDRVQDTIDDKLREVDEEQVLSLADLYRLRLALLELDMQRDRVARQLELARSALTWQAGLPPDRPPELGDVRLEPVDAQIPVVSVLEGQAFASRPDWRRLQAGIQARQAQEDMARSAYLPRFYLAGGVRYAVAPGRTNQRNPFVVDNFNYRSAGAFLLVQQSFEWKLLGADRDQARARLMALKATEQGAVEGIRLDVQRSYTAYREAADHLEYSQQARRLGRQWLQEALDDYDFDPQTLDDLVTAFRTHAQLEQDYLSAVHDYNITVAELARTTGTIFLEAEPWFQD